MSTKNILAYVRVSTEKQVKEGISIESQNADIKRYCDYHKYKVKKVYEDRGVSAGSIIGRLALEKLIGDIEKGESMIIYDLSRLARNTLDSLQILEKLKAKGASLICLNPDIDFGTPIGEAVYSILMAVSKLERDNIARNVKAKLQHLSKQGKLRSRAPFGFKYVDKDHPMEPDEEQQKVIEKVIKLYDQKITICEIARILNYDKDNKCLSNNKRNKKPQIFYDATVKRILQLAGVLDANKTNKTVEQRIRCFRSERIEENDKKEEKDAKDEKINVEKKQRKKRT